MKIGDCIIPITNILNLSTKKCKGCNCEALKQCDKIPCCTKQICIFELLKDAKSQKEKA